MKLSALPKPTEVDLPLNDDEAAFAAQRRNAFFDGGMTLPDDETGPEIEVSDDDESFEQQLVIAVDYIRKMQNFLGFIHQNNSQHQWLGEKSADNLQNLVEEVEDFLGEYTT